MLESTLIRNKFRGQKFLPQSIKTTLTAVLASPWYICKFPSTYFLKLSKHYGDRFSTEIYFVCFSVSATSIWSFSHLSVNCVKKLDLLFSFAKHPDDRVEIQKWNKTKPISFVTSKCQPKIRLNYFQRRI